MGLDLYIGADESNNGRAFEIHTTVFSIHPSDAAEVSKDNLLPKFRTHKNLFNRLKKRDYSFLLFTDSDRNRIPKHERAGAIVTSLLYEEFDWSEFDSFNFLLDGDRNTKELDYLVDIVTAKIPKIKSGNISVSYGGKYDQRYLVVNLADQLAHYLFRKGIDYVSEHEDRKALLY
jgi:hypothetical protein